MGSSRSFPAAPPYLVGVEPRAAHPVILECQELGRTTPARAAPRPLPIRRGKSVWSGKPAAVISCSIGPIGGFGANHHLRQSLVFLNMPAMQQPEGYIGGADKLFDESGKLTVDSTREFLTKYITAYAGWVDKHTS